MILSQESECLYLFPPPQYICNFFFDYLYDKVRPPHVIHHSMQLTESRKFAGGTTDNHTKPLPISRNQYRYVRQESLKYQIYSIQPIYLFTVSGMYSR